MKKIRVCLSPALISNFELTGAAVVVIDVLRATSTMIAAIDSGVKEIIPVASLDEARTYLGKDNHIVAGERNGFKIDDFDLGNSPLQIKSEKNQVQGKTLVMTTTNGTKSIELAKPADKLFIGSFANLNAVIDRLASEDQVICLCAGWKNRVNMEDTLFAGALVAQLSTKETVLDDASILAKNLYNLEKGDLLRAVKGSSHYRRLAGRGLEDDIAYCLELNTSSAVPRFIKRVIK